MADARTVADRLRSLYDKGRWAGRYTAGEKSEIEALSWQILGKGIEKCNCRSVDRYADAVTMCLIQINKSLKSNNMKSTTTIGAERRYHLKKGVVIEWNHKIYTHLNLTDEVAAAYLAKFPNAKSRFVAYPETVDNPNSAENGGENGVKSPEKPAKKGGKTSKKSVKSEESSEELDEITEDLEESCEENAGGNE